MTPRRSLAERPGILSHADASPICLGPWIPSALKRARPSHHKIAWSVRSLSSIYTPALVACPSSRPLGLYGQVSPYCIVEQQH